MRNIYGAYANAVQTWAANLSSQAITRTISALDQMRDEKYTTELLMRDVYEYWRDFASFRAPASLGLIPAASLDISSWGGAAASNFVQIPIVPDPDHLELTPVVNPQTQTLLGGLELEVKAGSNAARVKWLSGKAGHEPTSADRHGLFQGGIFHTETNELIATVYARVHLP